MALCGSYNCGCALTSTPAVSGAVNGFYPTINVSGGGEPLNPWDLTLDTNWTAQIVAGFTAAPWTVGAITQGVTLSKTTSQSYVHKFGKIVHCHATVAFTSAGTAAQPLLITLPSTSVSSSVGGSFMFIDNGTTYIAGSVAYQAASVAAMFILSSALFGASTTVAAGDSLNIDIWYVEV